MQYIFREKIKPLKSLFLVIFLITILFESINASGAYDKGTSAGKGNFEINLTLNPYGIISYGQDYIILNYGLSDYIDIVSYYSSHNNGTKSAYWGLFYQFIDNNLIDLGTAFGSRKTFNKQYGYDLFFPQLLYNFKLPKDYTIGGSIVSVYGKEEKYVNRGYSVDITFYKPLNSVKKISKKIIDAYFGFGVFKNTEMSFNIDKLYLQYSIDIKFDLTN